MIGKTDILSATCIALVLILFSGVSFSQQDISDYQKRLKKISQQIEELRAKIKKEEKKELSILSRLDTIGFSKRLIRKEISLYNVKLGKANRELFSIKKGIPALKAKLDREKQSIEKTLVTMYKFGKFNTLQFMLQAEDMATLISESKNLTLLAKYQEKIIAEYLSTLTQLRTAEEKLESKKQEISHLLYKATQKRKELEAQERKNRTLIREIKKNKETYIQTLEELKERTEQLQLLIKKLLREEITLPFPLIPLYEKKGKLSWPIEGKVVTRFGLQKHPRFNTVTLNNGIEISPRKNSVVVKSIHSGKVVYADYFKGYGDLIIIDHGMTYYSLYGRCSEFLVKKGDLVRTEHPIALVGDISSTKGMVLYFEIRYKTKPLNPLKWLKRR